VERSGLLIDGFDTHEHLAFLTRSNGLDHARYLGSDVHEFCHSRHKLVFAHMETHKAI
jgi:hypothetical protein